MDIESVRPKDEMRSEPNRCPICGVVARAMPFTLYDDRYGLPGSFGLNACTGCGHRYLDVAFSEDELSDLYSTRYPRSFNAGSEPPRIHAVRGLGAWLSGARAWAYRWVPQRVKVLDIGCGAGESVSYHQARGCRAVGVEADRNVEHIARTTGLDIHIGLFDPNQFGPEEFDFVTADQVLEHVADPVEFLTGVGKVLAADGYLILSTPNGSSCLARFLGRRWVHWHAPYHLHVFSRESLHEALNRAGFEPIVLRTLTDSRWLRLQALHLVSRPVAGTPSPLWDPQRSRGAVSRAPRVALAALARMRALDVVTRLLDAAGLGDNLLVVARRSRAW